MTYSCYITIPNLFFEFSERVIDKDENYKKHISASVNTFLRAKNAYTSK
jgi:hypothetical protein